MGLGKLYARLRALDNPLDLMGALSYHLAMCCVGVVVVTHSQPLGWRFIAASILALVFGWRFLACLWKFIGAVKRARGIWAYLGYGFLIVASGALLWGIWTNSQAELIDKAVRTLYFLPD